MKSIFFGIILLAVSSLAWGQTTPVNSDVVCKGFYSQNKKDEKFVEQEVILTQTTVSGEFVRLEAVIEPMSFIATINTKTDETLLFIVQGPDFLNGISSSGKLNDSNKVQLSHVQNTVVYKLVCQKLL